MTAIILLNDRWRVADDPIQWILQRRRRINGGASANSRKRQEWEGYRYCRTRTALIRDIRENCGEVYYNALMRIHALPEWHDASDVLEMVG